MKLIRVSLSVFLALLCSTLLIVNNGCESARMDRHAGSYPTNAPPAGYEHAMPMQPSLSPAKPSARHEREASLAMHHAAPAGSLPALDEEVWVIVKPAPGNVRTSANDDYPGCGAIMCRDPSSGSDVPLPLEHTDVNASISAYIASVNVTQQFHNPFSSKIEAVYVFPLPENAAINGFVMTIGDRRIRGIIREREEAVQIYEDAKRQGHVASLLTQERPNIFTQHVANIEPGRRVDVDITYFHTLSYDDGWYEYVFPMVVGPRFNPPGSGRDGIGAVGYGNHGASRQRTEVQYTRPNQRSGHDISVAVNIMAGVPIEEVHSPSHRIQCDTMYSEEMRVTLARDDSIPNKDFVLRYRVAGETVKTALLTHRDPRTGEGYFTLMLVPPRSTNAQHRMPMEMIFVIDCSGSMKGEPIAQAKAAIDHALTRLRPGDTFQVVVFSNDASKLGKDPLPVNNDNIRAARQYVRELEANGGTMMLRGLRAALNFRHDPERLRVVTFMTDGFIGNEADILEEEAKLLGASRIFSFGVGSSPNRFLLSRMAKLGRGAVAYLGLNDSGADVMDAFYSRISQPVLYDIDIDWGGMWVSDVVASGRDLYVGRPVIFTGKFTGEPASSIRVRGNSGGMIVEAAIRASEFGATAQRPALAAVWARMHIAHMMDEALYKPNRNLEKEIEQLALHYGLMSAFTSFVAVDSTSHTSGRYGTTVPVAVPVPDGVQYETTVSEGHHRR